MSNTTLIEHYERKYGHERHVSSIEDVPRTATPCNRFEAAVHYLPKFLDGGEVLELGAGNGNVAKALLDDCLDLGSYTLGDISASRVQGIAASIANPKVRVSRLDAEALPYELGKSFDAVIMIALIEHLIDPLRAMQGVRRLIRPGGFVYLDTPNIAKYTRRLLLLAGRFPSTASRGEGLRTYDGNPVDLHDEGHLHYFTYRSLERMLLERCGFSRVTYTPYVSGRMVFNRRVGHALAKKWPTLFSELALVAHV